MYIPNTNSADRLYGVYLADADTPGLGATILGVTLGDDGAEYTASFAVSETPVSVHLGTDYVSSFNPIGVGYFDDLTIRAEADAPFVG